VTPIRISRCTQPQDPHLTWRNYEDEEGTDVVALETATALRAHPLPRAELIARYAEITQLRDAASRGELIPDEDVKPISLDPELWELRWRFGREIYRQYHAEPVNMPGWLVALRFHRKHVVPGDDAQTASLQHAEIVIAQRRMLQSKTRP
jgi:hypothetical protein